MSMAVLHALANDKQTIYAIHTNPSYPKLESDIDPSYKQVLTAHAYSISYNISHTSSFYCIVSPLPYFSFAAIFGLLPVFSK